MDKFQNILYFLVIGSVSIFLMYVLLSWLKWIKSKKMEQNHSFENFEVGNRFGKLFRSVGTFREKL